MMSRGTCAHWSLLLSLFILLSLAGCATAPPQPAPAPQAEPQAPSAPNMTTYGTITSRVQKGKTTQSELIELFGGPNISTTDPDGTEVWVYEVKSSSTNVATRDSAEAKVKAFDVFFGLGMYGQASGQSTSQGNTSVTYSMKNITFIVKFNKDKTVKDYSVRQVAF